jgi:hypothetical protein
LISLYIPEETLEGILKGLLLNLKEPSKKERRRRRRRS